MKHLILEVEQIARRAAEAAREMACLSNSLRSKAVKQMALDLRKRRGYIIKENKKDILRAKQRGIKGAFLERLILDEKRIHQMSVSLEAIAGLKDLTGDVIKAWKAQSGLWIHKVRVPIGVVAIIYESRPDVTSDCIGLCLKSGNSVVLRGGSDAINSNLAIFNTLSQCLNKFDIPKDAINIIDNPDRKAVDALLKLNQYIDVVIPRGGESLIRAVAGKSTIPVIKHYKGICHTYVDEWADLNMAQEICFNAKCQRPGVCNAMETMLVHADVAARFLPGMLKKFKDAQVEIRGCALTQRIVRGIKRAKEDDFRTEYLDLILSVKVVSSLDQAIRHINNYGSHHSDAIITENHDNALSFLNRVDSACVYLNASTRFTDGYQFGMGAEIGISTDKLHARGPMALEELTTYKYMVFGKGQIRK